MTLTVVLASQTEKANISVSLSEKLMSTLTLKKQPFGETVTEANTDASLSSLNFPLIKVLISELKI